LEGTESTSTAKSLKTWLETDAGIERQDGHLPYLTKKPKVLEYLAQLVYQNDGNMAITTIGEVQFGVGPYGVLGLSVQDAMHLQDMTSFVNGFLYGTGESPESLHAAVQAEMHRVEEEFQKAVDSGIIQKAEPTGEPPLPDGAFEGQVQNVHHHPPQRGPSAGEGTPQNPTDGVHSPGVHEE